MRGLDSASVLRALAARFARQGNLEQLDVGRGFDIIVGTSTGGILAAGLAAGVSLDRICALYRCVGPKVFRNPVPWSRSAPRSSLFKKARLYRWVCRHLNRSANDNRRLREALERIFEDETLGQLYRRRKIGLCIPATSLLKHSPRVFKTAHLDQRDRDDGLALVDVCMATSAAPILLPLVSLGARQPASEAHADGGLWANNPVLIGLLEGLAVSRTTTQPVHVLSVGTCAPAGGANPASELDRGILGWRGGVQVMDLAMNAQGNAACHSANLLGKQLDRLGKAVTILRLPESAPSAEQTHLLHLDAATSRAMSLMESLGRNDGHETYRWCQDQRDERGKILATVFSRMPDIKNSVNRQENSA